MAFQLDGSDPQAVFGALAALIFLGFVGNLIFRKLRFNDTLILIAIGVVLGPVMNVLDPAAVAKVSAIVGPLALILILFDGGLALRLRDLLHGLGSAAMLGVVGFILTTVLLGGITAFALDVPFTTGLVLGAILGGTSALVVLPSLENMKCDKKTATTLGLESALTDVLVVVVSFTLISIVAAGAAAAAAPEGNATAGVALDAQDIVSALSITFAMALFLGAATGFMWLIMLPKFRDKPFGYMLTLGAMFALYVVVEWLLRDVSSGGGPLAVLAFGIVLGNHASFGPVGTRVGDDFGSGMKRFQGEISFLVRTFFFVYLGILVDLNLFKDLTTWAIGTVLFAAMLVARYIAVAATTRRWKFQGDDWIVWAMGPRGLAAAVLAAIPAELGIPGTGSFVALAFLILVFTNLFATIGAFVLGKDSGSPGAGAPSRGATNMPARAARAPTKKTSKTPAKKAAKAPAKSTKAPAKKASTAKTSSSAKKAPTKKAAASGAKASAKKSSAAKSPAKRATRTSDKVDEAIRRANR